MTENRAQHLLFSGLTALEAGSPVARWGLGLLANLFLLGLIAWVGSMTGHHAELGKGRRWVSLKALPASPDPIEFTHAPTARPRPKLVRKAILPNGQTQPTRSTRPQMELPEPPVLAAASQQRSPIIQAPSPLLPTPPPPKPILGTFAGNESLRSSPKAKLTLALEGAGFNSDIGPSLQQRGRAKVQTAFEEVHRSSGSNRDRQTIQESTFASSAFPHTAKVGARQVLQTEFGSSGTTAKSERKETVVRVANAFDSLPTEVQRQRKLHQQMEPSEFKPVEILSKARPQYTEEARKLGIEGDVRIRVLFGADGKLKVMGIVGSLGYGLDENAAIAVSQIQYRPATRMGAPVEQSAIVRVQFQLAN